jgi:hypothetical protein
MRSWILLPRMGGAEIHDDEITPRLVLICTASNAGRGLLRKRRFGHEALAARATTARRGQPASASRQRQRAASVSEPPGPASRQPPGSASRQSHEVAGNARRPGDVKYPCRRSPKPRRTGACPAAKSRARIALRGDKFPRRDAPLGPPAARPAAGASGHGHQETTEQRRGTKTRAAHEGKGPAQWLRSSA